MRVTGLGHASALIETEFGSVLTDPWVNPAYFGSWFPFPDNSGLDWERIGQADYLFISHLHRDHFDPVHLERYVSKKATVLLPAYATTELEDELRDLGFTSFVKTVNDEVRDVDGLQVMIQSLTAPTDGPVGDSSLWLSDGTTVLLNQNDARPSDLTSFAKLGHVDVHLLQFSGAIWFPMVYDLPKRAKQALGATKRERQFDRTLRYIRDVEASYVMPTAGPPCFLDDELWGFNDIFDDESNIFPDQKVFLDWLEARGRTNGRLLLPGTVAHVTEQGCPLEHPMTSEAVDRLFADKTSYLIDMKARRQPEVEKAKQTWAHPEIDVMKEITEWFTPLLEEADHMAAGINGGVRFTARDPERGDIDFILDFVAREVREYADEKVRYQFQTKRAYLEQLIFDHEIDWVNSLFLSCRFTASRVGPYNEYVYTFFKCLSEERLNYAEGWYAEAAHDDETIEMGGYAFQRRCPHLKADLTRFGKVEDGVLTCQMHGWKWRLDNGRCITSVGRPLRTEGKVS
ncbi:Rieske 2Fe-2S domain-containing protein [Jatrophihabitans sp. DSM 45814]